MKLLEYYSILFECLASSPLAIAKSAAFFLVVYLYHRMTVPQKHHMEMDESHGDRQVEDKSFADKLRYAFNRLATQNIIMLGWFAFCYFTPRSIISQEFEETSGDGLVSKALYYFIQSRWLAIGPGLWTHSVSPTTGLPMCGFEVGWRDVMGLLSCLGSLFRLWSMAVLGRHFTYIVGVKKEHKLITTGPYALLRHPSYTGLIIGVSAAFSYVGFSFWITLLVAARGTAFIFYRMDLEEKIMLQEFGKEYENLMKTRKRLIPYIY